MVFSQRRRRGCAGAGRAGRGGARPSPRPERAGLRAAAAAARLGNSWPRSQPLALGAQANAVLCVDSGRRGPRSFRDCRGKVARRRRLRPGRDHRVGELRLDQGFVVVHSVVEEVGNRRVGVDNCVGAVLHLHDVGARDLDVDEDPPLSRQRISRDGHGSAPALRRRPPQVLCLFQPHLLKAILAEGLALQKVRQLRPQLLPTATRLVLHREGVEQAVPIPGHVDDRQGADRRRLPQRPRQPHETLSRRSGPRPLRRSKRPRKRKPCQRPAAGAAGRMRGGASSRRPVLRAKCRKAGQRRKLGSLANGCRSPAATSCARQGRRRSNALSVPRAFLAARQIEPFSPEGVQKEPSPNTRSSTKRARIASKQLRPQSWLRWRAARAPARRRAPAPTPWPRASQGLCWPPSPGAGASTSLEQFLRAAQSGRVRGLAAQNPCLVLRVDPARLGAHGFCRRRSEAKRRRRLRPRRGHLVKELDFDQGVVVADRRVGVDKRVGVAPDLCGVGARDFDVHEDSPPPKQGVGRDCHGSAPALGRGPPQVLGLFSPNLFDAVLVAGLALQEVDQLGAQLFPTTRLPVLRRKGVEEAISVPGHADHRQDADRGDLRRRRSVCAQRRGPRGLSSRIFRRASSEEGAIVRSCGRRRQTCDGAAGLPASPARRKLEGGGAVEGLSISQMATAFANSLARQGAQLSCEGQTFLLEGVPRELPGAVHAGCRPQRLAFCDCRRSAQEPRGCEQGPVQTQPDARAAAAEAVKADHVSPHRKRKVAVQGGSLQPPLPSPDRPPARPGQAPLRNEA